MTIKTNRSVNGDRIKQAREIKGLTQAELADRVGVSQPAIAQLEQTQPGPAFIPSDDLIESISFALGFPVSFFKRESGPEFPLGSLLYRKKMALKSMDRNKVRQLARFAYELTEHMSKRLRMPALNLPRLTDDDAVTGAQVTRSALGLSPDTPVKNIIHQLEKNGVLVLAVPYEIDEHDSFSAWITDVSPPKPVIVISASKPGDRQRFSVSHEIAHLVMHSTYQGDLKTIEDQADRFAAEFLMPEEAIRMEFQTPVTLSKLAALKPVWGVSIQALARRALDVEKITYRQYTYLFEQISRLNWRRREPENLDITPEKPRALRKMAEVTYGIPINYKKAASEMDVPPSLIKSLLDLHADRQDLARRPKEPLRSNRKTPKEDSIPIIGTDNVISIYSKRK